MLNHITLEVRAGKDLQDIKMKDGEPYTCRIFALHEIYVPPQEDGGEPSKITMPIFLNLSPRATPLAAACIKKGDRFTVDGRLRYYMDPDTNKEWWSIDVSEVTPPIHPKGSEEAK